MGHVSADKFDPLLPRSELPESAAAPPDRRRSLAEHMNAKRVDFEPPVETISTAGFGAPPKAPAAPPAQRTRFLAAAQDQAGGVRKAANAIKRGASLVSAAIYTGDKPQDVIDLCESTTLDVMERLGYLSEGDSRWDSVMPIALDAISYVIAECARNGDSLTKSAQTAANLMVDMSRSKTAARIIESAWPSDIDNTTALRFSATVALSSIAAELAASRLFQEMAPIVKEAGKLVVGVAVGSAKRILPEATSESVRVMFTQSLIQSAAKLYCAVARREAIKTIESKPAEPVALDEVAASPTVTKAEVADCLQRIGAQFSDGFNAIVASSTDLFAHPVESVSARPAPAQRPKP
jgi:hypothetical protein